MCLTVFVFINAPGNPPYMGKTLQKSEKNILQISHLIFWMLRATKYLICDFNFTSFLFIRSKLNWPLFSFIWNICTRKKLWTRLKLPSEIFGCGENGRQSSKILNDIAPIAPIPLCNDGGNVHLAIINNDSQALDIKLKKSVN